MALITKVAPVSESNKTKALKRFAKVLGAAVVGALIGWLSGPDALALVGTQYAYVITLVAIPAASALQKWIGEQNV